MEKKEEEEERRAAATHLGSETLEGSRRKGEGDGTAL